MYTETLIINLLGLIFNTNCRVNSANCYFEEENILGVKSFCCLICGLPVRPLQSFDFDPHEMKVGIGFSKAVKEALNPIKLEYTVHTGYMTYGVPDKLC